MKNRAYDFGSEGPGQKIGLRRIRALRESLCDLYEPLQAKEGTVKARLVDAMIYDIIVHYEKMCESIPGLTIRKARSKHE